MAAWWFVSHWKMEDGRWEMGSKRAGVSPSREATVCQAEIRKELKVYLSSTVRLIHEGRRRQSNTAWTRTVFASVDSEWKALTQAPMITKDLGVHAAMNG